MRRKLRKNGGKDFGQNRLVICRVGAESLSGVIVAHACTNGGVVREYRVERSERNLQFADEPPGHRDHWKRARKILQPTADGFEERLEVDDGSGYVTYYAVSMQKVNAAPRA